jgi:hypothetical protein
VRTALKEPRAFPEVLRAVSAWPRWMDRAELDRRCRELYSSQPVLCDRYLRQESPWWPLEFVYLHRLWNPATLRDQLANDGLVAYSEDCRLAAVCVRPEGWPEMPGQQMPEPGSLAARAGVKRGEWAEGVHFKPAGEMLRAVAFWPSRLTLDELGERCRELVASRPLLCRDFLGEESDSLAVRDRLSPFSAPSAIRADDWRTLRRHLAQLGLISFDARTGLASVRAVHPLRPRHPSLATSYAAHGSSRRVWSSQGSPDKRAWYLMRLAHRAGRWFPESVACRALDRMREAGHAVTREGIAIPSEASWDFQPSRRSLTKARALFYRKGRPEEVGEEPTPRKAALAPMAPMSLLRIPGNQNAWS